MRLHGSLRRSVGCAVLCGFSAIGAATAQEVAILLHAEGVVPQKVILEAEARTSRIFEDLGVRLVWNNRTRRDSAGCSQAITLALAAWAPKDAAPAALAYAHLRTGSITVFYDRIKAALQAWPMLAAALLSHVFAHEIAHVLQSLDRHSQAGILKARWSRDEFFLMLKQRLVFTPVDGDLIRAGAARSCAPTHTAQLLPVADR